MITRALRNSLYSDELIKYIIVLLFQIENKVDNVDTTSTTILTTVNSNAQMLATMGISNDALIAKIEVCCQNI